MSRLGRQWGDGVPVQSPTEGRNPHTADLDLLPTQELLRVINAQDALVSAAVERALPDIARAVDLAVDGLSNGHSVHYFGAGSSGRVAVADAAELGPTFGLAPGLVVAHLAGGAAALTSAVEGVEDNVDAGCEEAKALGGGDVAIGLTASGRTPYVAGALEMARDRSAATVLISANPDAAIVSCADVHICVETGPEVLTGSTRMKAATAQKLVLNAFSTATMVRLGRTYSNLMTSLEARNGKLHGRMVTILAEASGEDPATCGRILGESDGHLDVALIRLLGHVDDQRARQALDESGGVVRAALQSLGG